MKDIESRKLIGKLICVLRSKNIIDDNDMKEILGEPEIINLNNLK